MTTTEDKSEEADFLASFGSPEERLYYYDFPLVYAFRTSAGALYLAYWHDCDGVGETYIAVRVNEQIVAGLEFNKITVRDALQQEELWLVRWEKESVKRTRSSFSELDQAALPDPGVYLR